MPMIPLDSHTSDGSPARLSNLALWKLGESAGGPSPALKGTLSPFEGERERERGPTSIPRPTPIQGHGTGGVRTPWTMLFVAALGMLALLCASEAQDSSGVALPPGVKAVWDPAKAFRETTPTRERLCINGLWRWQPAADNAVQAPPPAGLARRTTCRTTTRRSTPTQAGRTRSLARSRALGMNARSPSPRIGLADALLWRRSI